MREEKRRGRPRKQRFLTLANSYHGETLGALAVGDVAAAKNAEAGLHRTGAD